MRSCTLPDVCWRVTSVCLRAHGCDALHLLSEARTASLLDTMAECVTTLIFVEFCMRQDRELLVDASIVIAAIMYAHKYCNDECYGLSDFATIFHVPIDHLRIVELHYFEAFSLWDMVITRERFHQYAAAMADVFAFQYLPRYRVCVAIRSFHQRRFTRFAILIQSTFRRHVQHTPPMTEHRRHNSPVSGLDVADTPPLDMLCTTVCVPRRPPAARPMFV